MTTRQLRLVATVFCGLLAVAAAASAECAWVLWTQPCRYNCQSDGWLLQTAL